MPSYTNPVGHAQNSQSELDLIWGGRSEPYSDQIPLCLQDQELERILKVNIPNPDGTYQVQATSLDPNLPPKLSISVEWEDPTNDDISALNQLMAQAHAIGLCQMNLPQNPNRYGLFWIKDPLRRLDEMPVQNDTNAMRAAREEAQSILPEEFKKCQPSQADYDEMLVNYQDSLDFNSQFLESLKDLYRTDQANSIANDLSVSNPFLFDVNNSKSDVLKNIIDFALQSELPEDEIREIFSDLTYVTSDADALLYGFATVVSLRSAQVLHWKNRQNGGIQADFDDFVESVVCAINDGRIGFRVFTYGDLTRQSAMAAYDSVTNVIMFPPLDNSVPVISMFKSIVHECYHAYQDMKAKPMTTLDSESQAWEVGIKTALLASLYILQYNIDTGLNQAGWDNFNKTLEQYSRLEIQSMRCMGYPEWIIEDYQMKMEQSALDNSIWNYYVQMELLGYPQNTAENVFKEAFKIAHAKGIVQYLTMQRMPQILPMAYEMKKDNPSPGVIRTLMVMQFVSLVTRQLELIGTNPDAPQYYQTAYALLQESIDFSYMTYILDRDFWTIFQEHIRKSGMNDLLDNAMVQMPFYCDDI